jgi:hypothetical protein
MVGDFSDQIDSKTGSDVILSLNLFEGITLVLSDSFISKKADNIQKHLLNAKLLIGDNVKEKLLNIMSIVARISHYLEGSLVPLSDLMHPISNIEKNAISLHHLIDYYHLIFQKLQEKELLPYPYLVKLRMFSKTSQIAEALLQLDAQFKYFGDEKI